MRWRWANSLSLRSVNGKLLAGGGEHLPQGGPKAERSVTHRQLRVESHPPLLRTKEEVKSSLFALAVAFDHADQLLAAISSGLHQHQQALLLVGVIFQANVCVDAVGPDVIILVL